MFKPTQISASHHLQICRSVHALTLARETAWYGDYSAVRNLPPVSITRYQSADLFMQCLFVKCHICYISAQLSCVFKALSDFFETDGVRPMTNIYLRHEWMFKLLPLDLSPNKANWVSPASLWGWGQIGRERCIQIKSGRECRTSPPVIEWSRHSLHFI